MRQKPKGKLKNWRILGIETSCDETSVAILECPSHVARPASQGRVRLVKHLIATQIPIHARYGGVVPEVAARTHVAEIVSLLDKTLGKSRKACPERVCESNGSEVLVGSKLDRNGSRITDHGSRAAAWAAGRFDAIAVTQGPGLATALRVGVEAAKTLAWAYGKPLVPVNHLEGHLASAWLVPANRKRWQFPILFLLVSGGHTELVLAKDFGKYKILARTRDDAAGEAFDKTAKLLGLPYPGGPHLSKLAVNGNPKAFTLPRPMIHDPSLDFSFSGLKTAVRQLVEGPSHVARPNVAGPDPSLGRGTCDDCDDLANLCASIQAAIVDVLVSKTIKAAKLSKPKSFAVVGGVSANLALQQSLKAALKRECPDVTFLSPAKGLHTDNGAMIAAAGAWNLFTGKKLPRWQTVDAEPDLDL